MRKSSSNTRRQLCLTGVLGRYDVLERLEAVVAELEPGGDGPEVARVIINGLLEELEAGLHTELASEVIA